MLTPCTATHALPPGEVERLGALPAAAFDVKAEPVCEFDEHDPAVWHCALVQAQDRGDEEPVTNWWLRWSSDGEPVFTHEATCGAPVEGNVPGDGCLQIAGHPGRCAPLDESPPADAGLEVRVAAASVTGPAVPGLPLPDPTKEH